MVRVTLVVPTEGAEDTLAEEAVPRHRYWLDATFPNGSSLRGAGLAA